MTRESEELFRVVTYVEPLLPPGGLWGEECTDFRLLTHHRVGAVPSAFHELLVEGKQVVSSYCLPSEPTGASQFLDYQIIDVDRQFYSVIYLLPDLLTAPARKKMGPL